MKNSTQINSMLLLKWCMLLLLITPKFIYSQETKTTEYRTLNAYISDFSKNELFVKKSMVDYSNSIVENQLESRTKATANRITEKLIALNKNLKLNDKGYKSNTLLRDSFIKMNEKTIECLNNGTLIMNDYELQSLKSPDEIIQNLKERQLNLTSYFTEIRLFEESKREFGCLFNVNIRNFTGKNILEYNAFENILFYKINVIDEKINASILKMNKEDFFKSITALENINQEVILKTNNYKNSYNDSSLNNANIAFSNFIFTQKAKLVPLFNSFYDDYILLQKLKNATSEQEITQYNSVVRSYNLKKNQLYDTLDIIQKNKKILFDNFFVVNRTFLKNNMKQVDLYESYTYND
ncbi:hypothetical protein OX283_007315 [Flavobacterium sp. SUN052]|uniref:hypothetical protein n=1 Tax=Flavobacterium sp. SUN052 TaxID=3002441 RepID=UPI00237DDA13|nr:hypothetical protein [Flavobacterium sp. SUN052]MEC4004460.1 hypothetical protein [Flavobacterium sp. SUN052]